MGARGGPLNVVGYESSLVSVTDFKRSCEELAEALHLELGDIPDDFSDIVIDDLKIVCAEELIERGIQESTVQQQPPDVAGNEIVPTVKKRNRRRKQKGRPADYEARAIDLQLSSEVLAKLVDEQNRTREIAYTTLHSLRSKENEKSVKRLRRAGCLKFHTSTIQAPKSLSDPGDGDQTVSSSDVVISVDFHSSLYRTKAQEFVVLGNQPLTALRDLLYCVTDEIARRKGMVVPSGYFLIEDVFYNDMRHPEAVDYSEPIIKWIANQDEARKKSKPTQKFAEICKLKAAKMEETCFDDLGFKFGSHYAYCHQGDCKHVLVFRDARLTHPDDVQQRSAYPLLQFLPRLRYRKCSICSVYRAKKVTYDDKLAPSNPCFFCESCYSSLHYSKEGVLLNEDFREHDYFHET